VYVRCTERISDVPVAARCRLCAVVAAVETASTAQAESREKDRKLRSVHATVINFIHRER